MSHETPTESQYIGTQKLLSPGGPLARLLDPLPSRRSLHRTFRRAGIARWKPAGASSPGPGEVYFDRAAVTAWLNRNFGSQSPGALEVQKPGSPAASTS